MLDLNSLLSNLKRPKFLVQTARISLESYQRDRDISRVLGVTKLPKTGEAILLLLEEEKEQNQQRRERAAFYSYARHIEVLTAIMAEAELLRQISKQRQAM